MSGGKKWENMYYGSYDRILDNKGRLQIPARLNKADEKIFYMLRGFDGCISIYPSKNFEALMEKLSNKDFEDEDSRAQIRIITSSINELNVDSHGRIAIPKAVLNDYRIGSEVKIIGVLDHFEIWDTLAYATYTLQHSLGRTSMKGN